MCMGSGPVAIILVSLEISRTSFEVLPISLRGRPSAVGFQVRRAFAAQAERGRGSPGFHS